jgi:hypothetical protein
MDWDSRNTKVSKNWGAHDGFYLNSRSTDELIEMLTPDYKQWISLWPILDNKIKYGDQRDFTPEDFSEIFNELPEDVDFAFSENDLFGKCVSIYTYRNLTEEELALVQSALHEKQTAEEKVDRHRFRTLKASYPEWFINAINLDQT